MILTSKETDLLKDMKEQEELCIEKYGRYAEMAKCTELKTLLNSIADTERSHLKTINDMMSGNEPSAPSTLSANNNECKACSSVYSDAENKKADKWLFSAIHYLNIPWLITRRALWTICMWVLCGGCAMVCLSGVILGIKSLLRRK